MLVRKPYDERNRSILHHLADQILSHNLAQQKGFMLNILWLGFSGRPERV
jgi:hypothetical protein